MFCLFHSRWPKVPNGCCSQTTISVIIPANTEVDALPIAISTAVKAARSPELLELVAAVADDATAARLAANASIAGVSPIVGAGSAPTINSDSPGAVIPILRIVRSQSGRGAALNAGAAVATGDILLFLHADTLLPKDWDDQVCTIQNSEGYVAW